MSRPRILPARVMVAAAWEHRHRVAPRGRTHDQFHPVRLVPAGEQQRASIRQTPRFLDTDRCTRDRLPNWRLPIHTLASAHCDRDPTVNRFRLPGGGVIQWAAIDRIARPIRPRRYGNHRSAPSKSGQREMCGGETQPPLMTNGAAAGRPISQPFDGPQGPSDDGSLPGCLCTQGRSSGEAQTCMISIDAVHPIRGARAAGHNTMSRSFQLDPRAHGRIGCGHVDTVLCLPDPSRADGHNRYDHPPLLGTIRISGVCRPRHRQFGQSRSGHRSTDPRHPDGSL
jgi:hypothetical protein